MTNVQAIWVSCTYCSSCTAGCAKLCNGLNAGTQAADASPLHPRLKRLKRNQKGDAVPSKQHRAEPAQQQHAESALRMNDHVGSNRRFERMKQKADHSKFHRR